MNAPAPWSPQYAALTNEERAAGYVRPLRIVYAHTACLKPTGIPAEQAHGLAVDPTAVTHLWCKGCDRLVPVSELRWANGEVVGS